MRSNDGQVGYDQRGRRRCGGDAEAMRRLNELVFGGRNGGGSGMGFEYQECCELGSILDTVIVTQGEMR